MVCLKCSRGNPVGVCAYCCECKHLCKDGCFRSSRARTLDSLKVQKVYSVDKKEPLVRKFDICRQVSCRKTFNVTHPLMVYCSTECGRKDRNLNYRVKARERAG